MRSFSISVALALVTVAAIPARGQGVAPQKSTVISIQPISAMLSVYSAELEHVVAPTLTVGVGGNYWDWSDDVAKVRYTSADLKLRYYPEAHPLRGFSFGGQAGFSSLEDTEKDPFGGTGSKSKASGPTVGIALDYGWLLGASRSFYVGLGLGAKKIFAKADDASNAHLAYPTARISVGYAF